MAATKYDRKVWEVPGVGGPEYILEADGRLYGDQVFGDPFPFDSISHLEEFLKDCTFPFEDRYLLPDQQKSGDWVQYPYP